MDTFVNTFDTAMTVFAFLVILLGIPAMLVVMAWRAAKNNRQATFIEDGNIGFVVAGETLIDTLANIKDHHYKHTDGQGTVIRQIVSDSDDKQVKKEGWQMMAYLRKKWGFFWISLFYPAKKIHTFPIYKARLKSKPEAEGTESKTSWTEWIEYDPEPVMSTSLWWRIPRPMIIKNVPFQDCQTATLLFYGIFEVVFPYPPIFIFKGKFFVPIEAAVRSKILDFAQTKKLADFIKEPKGPNSAFGHFVLTVNDEAETETKTQSELALQLPEQKVGIVKQVGLRLIEGRIVTFKLDDEETATALKALELRQLEGAANIKAKELQGDAEKALAEREAEAERLRGRGRADALAAMLQAAGENVLTEQMRRDGLTGFQGEVLVIGTQGSGVNVNLPPVGKGRVAGEGNSSSVTPNDSAKEESGKSEKKAPK